MTINRAAREIWRDYLNETNPDAAEMLYVQYLNALREATPAKPSFCVPESTETGIRRGDDCTSVKRVPFDRSLTA